MRIIKYSSFEKTIKKLHPNEKRDLDNAIKKLIQNPKAGEQKKGDFNSIRVFKFKMVRQLTLLAYIYGKAGKSITLLALCSHENFYRDLKK